MGALKKQPHKKILHRPTSTGGVAIPQLVGVSLLSLRKDLQSAYPGAGASCFAPRLLTWGHAVLVLSVYVPMLVLKQARQTLPPNSIITKTAFSTTPFVTISVCRKYVARVKTAQTPNPKLLTDTGGVHSFF